MKRHAPATLRNREPILDVLRAHLPDHGTVLEVASGSGEHVAYFAARLPGLRWQPSDLDPAALTSIDAHVSDSDVGNVARAIELDASLEAWPILHADAILCCNMIHIAPLAAQTGLLRGAARVLVAGAPLVLYGPFREAGAHTAESNAAFDASLRERNPAWGVRNLDDVLHEAAGVGLLHERTVVMPAENRCVILRRS